MPRINLIDPIDVVSKFGSEYNGMPPYEQMNIFVELTVTRRGKTILVSSANGVQQDVDSTNVNINMLGFEQSKNSKFNNQHTTDWTNNVADDRTRYEGFGIDSINVVITPSAVPIINIEFVDIKGMNFLNKGEDSPYAVLYDFPPPIFYLTIKGYYGKKLSYTLHLLEQNTRFDGTTGNYYISAKFTSRTFSPLTDVLFNYIKIIPFTFGGGQITDDESKKTEPIPPTNTYELIRNIKQRNILVNKLNNTSKELKASNDTKQKIDVIDNYISLIQSSLFNQSNNGFTNVSNMLVYDKSIDESTPEIITNINEYNKFVTDKDISLNPNRKLLLGIIYKQVFQGNNNIPITSGSTIEAKRVCLDETITKLLNEVPYHIIPRANRKGLILNTRTVGDIKIIEYNTNKIAKETTYMCIDITKYYITLINQRHKLEKEYEVVKELYDEKVNELTIDTLGFEPTPNNVFRIIANDCDKFFSRLQSVGDQSDIHHEKYRNDIIGDINTKAKSNNTVPIGAFPFCYKRNDTTSVNGNGQSIGRLERAYPYDIPKFRQLGEPFPEVQFVEDYINASIDLSKLGKINSSKESTDVVGNNIWFPINPVDTTLKTNYAFESPFFQIERKRSYELNKLYDVLLNRYYIVSQYTCSDFFNSEKNYVTLVAKSEALNLTKTFIDKQLLGLLKTNSATNKDWTAFQKYISDSKNNIKYYSKVNDGNSNNYVKFDNSDILFYKTRQDENFVGFDYPDTAIVQRISTQNSDDLIEKFIDEQDTLWASVKKFITFDSNDVQLFTKENLIYFPDQNKTDNKYDSKFLNDDNYFKENSTLKLWAKYLTDAPQVLFPLFTGNSYTSFQQAFMMVSNIGRTRSFYHYKVSYKFNMGSVVEVPKYSELYMGALALAYHPDITSGNTLYSDQISALLSTLSGFAIKNIFDRDNLTLDKSLIMSLSKNDAEKLVASFNTFYNNGDGEFFSKMLDSIFKVIDETSIIISDDTGDRLEKYENSLNGSSFSDDLAGSIYILNFSDITFNERNRSLDQTSFTPIANLTGNQLEKTQLYFNTLFSELNSLIPKRTEELNNIDNTIFSRLNDNDVKNQMYYSFKTIYDRWMIEPQKKARENDSTEKTGFPLTGKPLFDSFRFVDRAFNDLGDKVMLNIDSLIDMENDYDLSVFQIISRILSENGFEFFPIENFMIFDSSHKWDDAFKVTETLDQRTEPLFIGMYIGGTSSILDNNSSSENDGIKNLETDIPLDFNATQSDDSFATVNAFRVRYGQQNQSFFTSIQFDQKEFTETNESLSILSSIADDQGNSSPVPKGQNLYNVYSQRSYTAKVSGIGNAMIQPMQYFQIENIPLFNGVYIILKVEHKIQMNQMVTSFEGMKLAKIPVPFVSKSFTSGKYRSETSIGIPESSTTLKTSADVVNNSNSQSSGDGSYPQPLIKNSMTNLFSSVGALKIDNS